MTSPVVAVCEGKLKGFQKKNLNGENFYSFLGIPFGKAPVGELRFKAPEPAVPWQGVRNATVDGDSSYQRNDFTGNIEGSEDCLNLSVYTKTLPSECNKLKPVMFWIYGGSFLSGSNKGNLYGPEHLMLEDIVLVSVNYRLGFLGFLHLDDTTLDVPGNAGIKDQQLALKWVQKNIRSFNGDPNNVTIFGESAGSESVHLHIVSPSSKGLFHKAILQSGCLLNPWAYSKDYGLEFAKRFKENVTTEKEALEILKKVPVDKIFEEQEKFYASVSTTDAIAPNIEKPNKTAVITSHPVDIITRGQYNKVPTIIGYNNREGLYVEVIRRLVAAAENKSPDEEKPEDFDLKLFLLPGLSEDDPKNKLILKTVRETYLQGPLAQDKFLLPTDYYFVAGIIAATNLHVQTSHCPIYLYRISLDAGLNLLKKFAKVPNPGTSHGDELGYLFKMELASKFLQQGPTEVKALKQLVKLWASFAACGNPTPSASNSKTTWIPAGKDLNFMDINIELTAGKNPESERRKSWKVIFQKFPAVSNNV
ncbi:juvenile hormone esterase-like [Diabrotica virgifera virgifera]|uniref:Carboxylesterase type B domain-containing protein n=2 Tax=Diabrotica virgifera virgifera TaxID=50390 RepID=A0ABM5KZ04_DIAVI|nr:juvenile hormone esterase-like [Diabrotica virgifera virgifera]